MKRLSLMLFGLLLVAGSATGQGGYIGAFTTTQGVVCQTQDLFGLITAFVVHGATAGATASQFSAPIPGCWDGAVYLSDTSIYPVTVGNSQTGVAIGYGACLAAPIHILTINVFQQNPASTFGCCAWPFLPDPNVASGQIEVVDCAGQLISGNGLESWIVGLGHGCEDCTTAVEDVTWGAVKAIYRE